MNSDQKDPMAWRQAMGVLSGSLPDVPSEELIRRVRSGEDVWQAGDRHRPPFVIHVNDMPNFPNAVYIGRAVPRRGLKASKWENPYKIRGRNNRDTVVFNYRLALNRGKLVHLLTDLPELTGKPLACWCRHHGKERTDKNACHGDVLVDLWWEQVGREASDADQ